MTWQPTWRRLIASTLVLFALVLAVLVWRLQSGDDPALGATHRAAVVTPLPQPQSQSPQFSDPGAATGGGVAPSTHQS